MSIRPKWKPVYWFAVLSVLGIIIEGFHLFERGITVSVVVVITTLCLSGVFTYIYKKIPWFLPFLIRIEEEKKQYELN